MKDTSTKVLISIVIILVIIAGVLFTIKLIKNNNKDNEVISLGTEVIKVNVEEDDKNITTYTGNERPIAVMIDNHKSALPQARIK